MNIEHYQEIRELVSEAEEFGTLLEPQGLTGFSGKKLVGTLQRLAKFYNKLGKGSYLEVGVFQGLTLISVARVLERATAYGIDNFSQFDPENINEKIILERSKVNDINNIHLINADYEDALESLKDHIGNSKIGVFFIDGPHDYRSQLICLNLIKPYLSDSSVIVIDDCNYRHVRLANRDFLLANPEFKLLFEAYTKCHPANMDKNTEQEARNGWWNGVNIIVHDPNNILGVMLPETYRDRQLYVNEHIVHSKKYSVIAPEALSFFSSLLSLRLISALKQFVKGWIKLRKYNKQALGKYPSLNTYSEQLPQRNYNETLQ